MFIHFQAPLANASKDSIQDPFYGVPNYSHAFVGRADILARMEEVITKCKSSKWCRPLALSGIGGMGKTQLMLQYCHIHKADYQFTFWLEAESRTTLLGSFRELARNLSLDNRLEKDSEEKIAAWVCNWLEHRTGWLLLFDNADDTMAQDVFDFIPRFEGDIILTTREFIPSFKASVIHVGKMEITDALVLLYGAEFEALIDREDAQFRDAQDIIAALDCMPLAINLARSSLEESASLPSLVHTAFNLRRGGSACL
jgi:NB-ARC domain